MIDTLDLITAIDYLEKWIPKDSSLEFSTITNEKHMVNPYGKGFAIRVTFIIYVAPLSVWEKGESFCDAAKKVVERLKLYVDANKRPLMIDM